MACHLFLNPRLVSKFVFTALAVLVAVTGCTTLIPTGTVSSTSTPTTAATPTPTATVPPTNTPAPTATLTPTASPQPAGDGVVDGWAVLAEKDDYADVGMVNLPIDYIDITRMSQVLLSAGWHKTHIREVREFDQEDLRQALAWLANNADADDIVFFYVSGHDGYLLWTLRWDSFFPADWAVVPGQQRVLLVEACRAAKLTSAVEGDDRPSLSIAAVDEDELAWAGLEEEELPIIGSVFTYYFVAAFADPEADADTNGAISVQEAALYAEGQQRTYMHEVVFAVPEFLNMYHDYPEKDAEYPDVIVDDTIREPVYLELAVP